MRLKEIDVIRPFLIILVVIWHSFIIYCGGGWKPIDGISTDVPLYSWIGQLAYMFMLECFVFVSGYVFGFQIVKRGLPTFSILLKNKILRLLLPCFLWSSLYLVLFKNNVPLYNIFSSLGHLWFLEMLFWCFVFGWILVKIDFNKWMALILLIILQLFSLLDVGMQLSTTFYYLLFFYAGINYYKYRKTKYKLRGHQLTIAWGGVILAIIACVIIEKLTYNYMSDDGISTTILYQSLMILAKTIRSFVGIYALFETAFFLKDFKFNRVYLNIGTYGMGIYILQQFVIMILYYHTAFPVLLGKYILPWFCFTITMLASYIATYGFMHSRIGRIMIGLNPAKK